MATTASDEIRKYVFDTYVVPARNQSLRSVTIKAGDVAKAVNFSWRVPQVCGAVSATKFQTKFGVRVLERHGPGQGSNTTFTFQV